VTLGKTLNAVSHLGPSSLPVVEAQHDEGHANEQFLCCMTDTEHSTTSGSKEEEYKMKT